MNARLSKILIGLVWIGSSLLFADGKEKSLTRAEFQQSLVRLLENTDKSISVLRKQVADNPSAPFTPELYLQLGEALSTKASALYYIEMERKGASEAATPNRTERFSEVIEVHREAIRIFERVLQEYPKHPKRAGVLYELGLSLKAIDEIPRFQQTASQLFTTYPDAIESARMRIVLGQYLTERALLKEAASMLTPVTKSAFSYEKNLAKYHLATVALAEQNPKQALDLFTEVITARDLKEEDMRSEVSLKARRVKSNLKREALVDSIRAYTAVYPNNPNPLQFYGEIAPTELMFYEVLEKLASRYVSLKRPDIAIRCLRILSEHSTDPQKVVSLYRDILLSIPVEERTTIPAQEIAHVLEKYQQLLTLFRVSPEVKKSLVTFFEIQVRDLATRHHERGKAAQDVKVKKTHLTAAAEFYRLHLAYFRGSASSVTMASNLADVYFNLGQYVDSSDYYLRASAGEFGKVSNAEDLIKSAISTAQKENEGTYFESIRQRALLVRATNQLMEAYPRYASDPKYPFLAQKARYEMGEYATAIEGFYGIMQKFPRSSYAVSAGEIVLDYYNTRQDFKGLASASQRILSSNIDNKEFVAKVQGIRQKALAKRVDEALRETATFDNLKQGQSYLNSALKLQDSTLKSAALERALAASRTERDIKTFFKTVTILAKNEKDPQKWAELKNAAAKEAIKMGRFYQGFRLLMEIYGKASVSKTTRSSALGEAFEVALLLRDWGTISDMQKKNLFGEAPPATRKRLVHQAQELLESPILPNAEVFAVALENASGTEGLLSYLKGSYRLPKERQADIRSKMEHICGKNVKGALCEWNALLKWQQRNAVQENGERQVASVSALEEKVNEFRTHMEELEKIGTSSDPHLAIMVSLLQGKSYSDFGKFLDRTATALPDLKSVLAGKAAESLESSRNYLGACKKIAKQTHRITPAHPYCFQKKVGTVDEMSTWQFEVALTKVSSDPEGSTSAFQQRVFGEPKNVAALYELAEGYLKEGRPSHAAASATVGLSLNQGMEGDFKAVLGCALVTLGWWSEAKYHLGTASEAKGLRDNCRSDLARKYGGEDA